MSYNDNYYDWYCCVLNSWKGWTCSPYASTTEHKIGHVTTLVPVHKLMPSKLIQTKIALHLYRNFKVQIEKK